jgi:phosphohistidine phosphatase
MKLVLVRHAIAEDREAFAATGAADEARPLTKKGRKRMRRAARGLREIVDDVDMIATSPLVRAAQTAEIIAAEYDAVQLVTCPFLAPDAAPQSFVEWLKRLEDVPTVVAVGHEPHIGILAAFLVTGNEQALCGMKKGSAALVEFDDEVKSGGASIRWFATPAQLRTMGDH